MRNVRIEVLRDILYYALRQTLRHMGHEVSHIRKGYDVVYYQSGNDYSTFSLVVEEGRYEIHHEVQDYNGNYTQQDFIYRFHEDERYITDLIECIHYVITSRLHK